MRRHIVTVSTLSLFMLCLMASVEADASVLAGLNLARQEGATQPRGEWQCANYLFHDGAGSPLGHADCD